MAIKRDEIQKKDRWNVEAIFENDQLWEDEYNKLKDDIKAITTFKDRLASGYKILLELINTEINLSRRLSKLYTYAHMRHDEDGKNELYKGYFDRAYNLMSDFDELSSFINPEIISIPDDLMSSYLLEEELAEYKFYLSKILRVKKHILSKKEERILSLSAKALSTAEDAFRSLTDADLKFGFIESGDKKLELTHGQYYLYIINKDREVREKAFKQYHNKFDEFPTTMASLLYGEIKNHVFNAKVRNFPTTLDASLFYKDIDKSVYTNLIDTVRKRIGSLHNYIAYRKTKMGLKELHLYDMYVPFIESQDIHINYEDAKDILLESTKVLGGEYYNTLKRV